MKRTARLRAEAFIMGPMDRPIGIEAGTGVRLGRAAVISLAVTAGFVLLFSSVGLVISAGGHFLITFMPWIGLIVGSLLALMGFWLLTGRGKLYFGLAQRASARINPGSSNKISSFFLFGIAYGMVSLSCTLPIFLVVVVSSTTAGNYLDGFFQFLAYSLGMGIVLTALTLAMAVFKGAVAGYLRAALPLVERLSAVLVTLAGLFIVYYWISIGGLGPDSWQVGFLNELVELTLGTLSNEASSKASVVPSYALAAGMLATVNPCGFALLPAYLSLYLRGEDSPA